MGLQWIPFYTRSTETIFTEAVPPYGAGLRTLTKCGRIVPGPFNRTLELARLFIRFRADEAEFSSSFSEVFGIKDSPPGIKWGSHRCCCSCVELLGSHSVDKLNKIRGVSVIMRIRYGQNGPCNLNPRRNMIPHSLRYSFRYSSIGIPPLFPVFYCI